MITKDRMNYEATRLYALAELIDTTRTIAFSDVNEGTDEPEAVLQRVHELLFAAFEVAHGAANDLSELMADCVHESPKPQPTKRRAKV